MTINSISTALNTVDSLVQDIKNTDVDSEIVLDFEETFKDVFHKKVLEEDKENLEKEDLEKEDEKPKEVLAMEIGFLNIPIDMRENSLGLDLKRENIPEEAELLVESNKNNIENLEIAIKDIAIEKVEIVEAEEFEGLEKTPIKENHKGLTGHELKEEKNKNIYFNYIKKLEKPSDNKGVGKEESINLDEIESLDRLPKAQPIEREGKVLEDDITSIFDREYTHIERNIPKVDTRDFSAKEIHQLPKKNIEIVNNSIIKLMETTKDGDTSTMKVKLYPEELGNVDVLLTMNESKLEVKILVENQNIKDMFNENMTKFNQSFEKEKINIQSFSVDVNQNFKRSQDERERNNRQRKYDKNIRIVNGLVDKMDMDKLASTRAGGISILA